MTTEGLPDIRVPDDLRPSDGRFGSGPSKIRQEAVEALAADAPVYLGTSHRRPRVRLVMAAIRNGLTELFDLPDGYEILFGNGGSTTFWDAATFGLVDRRSEHLVFGEFSSKFAAGVRAAPFLDDPVVVESEPGTRPEVRVEDGVDLYALTHNETSTGVQMPVARPEGTDALVVVDATSAAGGMRVDPTQFDVYYFAPQKCFASDGGLWIAVCSPSALARIDRVAASDRWIPASLDLAIARRNSVQDQTYNTQALATVHLLRSQLEWMLANGGLDGMASRCERSASVLYGWAEKSDFARPFVTEPVERSPVVGTVDLDDAVSATTVSEVLRANDIVDTESYRGLNRNQLRIAMYPAVEPDDVSALTASIDYIVERLA